MSGRLGNDWILEWKPFFAGFRLKFGGVADVVIAKRVNKYLLHKMHSRCGQHFLLSFSLPWITEC